VSEICARVGHAIKLSDHSTLSSLKHMVTSSLIQFIFIQSHVILFNKMHLLFVIYKMVPLQTGLVQVEIEREARDEKK
jgi:hypothetical protein